MKTAIFLSSSHLSVNLVQFYDFKEMIRLYPMRLVAIVNRLTEQALTEANKSNFSDIFVVDDEKITSLITDLNFEQTSRVVKNIISGLEDKNELAIIPLNEGSVYLAAALRELFNLQGEKTLVMEAFRDKMIMKAKLAEQGVRVPKFLPLNKIELKNNVLAYYEFIAEEIKMPFIVKPVSGLGSESIFKISSASDFSETMGEILSSKQDYEVEEFIEGELFHCELIFNNKKIIFCECSEYSFPLIDIKNGKNVGSISLPHSDKRAMKIKSFSEKVVRILGAPDGISHLEVFLTQNDELIFLEVAARMPGADIIPMLINTFGVNVLQLNLLAHLKINTHKLPYKKNEPCFWFYFPLSQGTVKKLNNPPIKSQYQLTWKIAEGDVINDSSQHMLAISGKIFVKNSDYKVLLDDYNTIKNYRLVNYLDQKE